MQVNQVFKLNSAILANWAKRPLGCPVVYKKKGGGGAFQIHIIPPPSELIPRRPCSCPVPPLNPALHSCRALVTCALHYRYTVRTSTAGSVAPCPWLSVPCPATAVRPLLSPVWAITEPVRAIASDPHPFAPISTAARAYSHCHYLSSAHGH